MSVFGTRGFQLHDWQREAVDAWANGADPQRGTLEIFTGGGKSLIALACAERAAKDNPDFRLLIIVPTKALAEQWAVVVKRFTSVPAGQVAMLKRKDAQASFDGHVVSIGIINTVAALAKKKELVLQPGQMIVVDECHRAGAPTFRAALDLAAGPALGLSATPEREELGDDGEPLQYDEQIVARKLGPVVFSFGLDKARERGLLPEYEIHHHGIALDADEKRAYEEQSRKVTDLSDRLKTLGGDPGRARGLAGKGGDVGSCASAYLAATAERKDLLYRARERNRIALLVARGSMADERARILIFHERIEAVESLAADLRADFAERVSLEHSRLKSKERTGALDRFRTGDAQILVSAKSLVEGIDVPAATVGISVASTASVRQRIQALGRVLRKGDEGKRAAMHVIYVADTVDESIYEKEDWSDLTGESQNRYWRWALDSGEPVMQDGPPRRPKPTEDQIAGRYAAMPPRFPCEWPGAIHGQEYSVDTKGVVTNASRTVMANPQSVAQMVEGVRGSKGGRFRVTPKHRFVLVLKKTESGFVWMVGGVLRHAFEALEMPAMIPRDQREDSPGETYRGPRDRTHGQIKIRTRGGGTIEYPGYARGLGGRASDDQERLRKYSTELVEAWKKHGGQTTVVYINGEWDAWYTRGGSPIFLGHLPGSSDK